MTKEEYEEKVKEQQKISDEEFNHDIETMHGSEFLKKYEFKSDAVIAAFALDPSKKALFNYVKRITYHNGKVLLQKYEINGKWYWGLPEDKGDQINILEENKNE